MAAAAEMLWVLGFETAAEAEDALAELAACEELNLVTWRNPESDRLRVQLTAVNVERGFIDFRHVGSSGN